MNIGCNKKLHLKQVDETAVYVIMKSYILTQSTVNLRLLLQDLNYFANKQDKDTHLSKRNICTKTTILLHKCQFHCSVCIRHREEHS